MKQISLILALSLAALTRFAHGQEANPPLKPMRDPGNGCAVFAPAQISRALPVLRWAGPCRDGLADGRGAAAFSARPGDLPSKQWNGFFRSGFFVGDSAVGGRIVALAERDALIELPSNAPQEGIIWLHARLDDGPLARCGLGVAELAIEGPSDLAVNDEARLRRMMQRAAVVYRQACPAPLGLRFVVVAQGKRQALATSFGGASDVIARADLAEGAAPEAIHNFRNIATKESDQGRRSQALADKKREQTAQSRAAWNEFTKANGVQLWVTPRQLDANPFKYEGKLVAFPAQFVRMISPDTALLREERGGYIVVSGLPRDLLQDRSQAVFAGRSVGKRELRISSQASSAYSSVEAKAWRVCQRAGCADFLQWMDEEPKPFPWGGEQGGFVK